MVAIVLPKITGDARVEAKQHQRIGCPDASDLRLIIYLAAMALVLVQTGCGTLDLGRSEKSFRLLKEAAASPASSFISLNEQQQIKFEQLTCSQFDSVNRQPGDSESSLSGESCNETGSSVSEPDRKSITQRLLSSKSAASFAWEPQLLIRANDEVSQEAKETDEPSADLDNLSNTSGSLSDEIGTVEIIDGIEYLTPEASKEIALKYPRERWRRVTSDYRNFYSQSSLLQLSAGFLIGAAMANTSFDGNFTEDVYRENVVDIADEDIAEKLHQPKTLGDGFILLPTLGLLAVCQPLLERSEWTSPLGELGDRGARAILVGGPFVLITQKLTGASRPYESPSGSRWEPFQDNNGVSGHAFVGAVPFLAAGKMSRQPWAKAVWYGASVLPALSRVNDEQHYFSQVFLGWYIAWLATNAVDDSIQRPGSLRVAPMWGPAGPGLMLEKQF